MGYRAVSPVRRLYTSLRTDDFLHTLGHFSRPVSRGTYCAKAGVLLVVMWSAADDSAEGVTIRVAAKGKANERISQVARRNRETSRRDRGLTRRAVARAVSPAVRARW